jgi:hypothetical protein
LCRASKETIWSILEDVDNWTDWSDPKSKTHMLSHKTIKREGNIVTCLEEEIAGGYRVKHTDKYTFYPKDKVTEDIIEGPVSGHFELPKEQCSTGPSTSSLRLSGSRSSLLSGAKASCKE